ncbi:hypothetical protein Veis_2836 [Verminephrobacter eiseniae EF01-2]|uniref:Uncharacterized protein n=1 Tax=Verminephrobacter eiseniae (strain EF01-2) TaxID=391735 RepID=A1WLR7_VEREI|nr:hypothetical protein Veis_2836 [Verminephrobacter eiseniae EF01-2]
MRYAPMAARSLRHLIRDTTLGQQCTSALTGQGIAGSGCKQRPATMVLRPFNSATPTVLACPLLPTGARRAPGRDGLAALLVAGLVPGRGLGAGCPAQPYAVRLAAVWRWLACRGCFTAPWRPATRAGC